MVIDLVQVGQGSPTSTRGKFAERNDGGRKVAHTASSQLTLTKQWTMSHEKNGAHEEAADVPSPRTRQHTNTRSDWRDKVGIPEPIKRVFRKFPLVTYDANNLPITSPAHRNEHTLWLWTTPEGAATGALSFNPSCLKWQVRRSPYIPYHPHYTDPLYRPTSNSETFPSVHTPPTTTPPRPVVFHSYSLRTSPPPQTKSSRLSPRANSAPGPASKTA